MSLRGGGPTRRLAVVVGAFLAAAAVLLTTATADSPAPEDEITAVLTEQLDAAGIPGGAYVTASADGAITAGGTGTTGAGEPVTADTPFVVGSTTKSFTALAVLQLVEAGKVDLDAPVTRYVPELQLADGEPVEAITVRHVLAQTSGLDDLTGGPVLASAREGTALEAVAELRAARLASRPGETWRYANANYVLAGLVVERASASSYADYVQRAILDPLDMTDSYLRADSAVASGHRYWFGLTVASGPVQREGVVAAGYLASTANDLGKYLTMYLRNGRALDGTRIVSAEGISTLTTPGPRAHLGNWAEGADARYAMGWFVGGPWAEPTVFHPGNSPDSSAMIALFGDRGLAAATLVPAGHELPVPGNPSMTDRISRSTLHAVLGEPVPTATSRWSFYTVFNLTAAILVGFGVWSVTRAVAARRHSRPTALRRWLRPLPSLLTAILVAMLPRLTAYDWAGVWTWAPDLAVVLLLLAALAVTTASLRLVTAVRTGRNRRQTSSAAIGSVPHSVPASSSAGDDGSRLS